MEGKLRTVSFRVEEDQYATFMAISKQKERSGAFRLAKLLEKQNEADLKGGKYKKLSFEEWSGAAGEKKRLAKTPLPKSKKK